MGDAATQINRGALNAIFFQQDLAAAQFQVPVLQCLQIKPMVCKSDHVAGYLCEYNTDMMDTLFSPPRMAQVNDTASSSVT